MHNSDQLSSILIEIESVLEKAEAARYQVESEIQGASQLGGLALPEEALRGHIEDAATLLAVALDIADLPGAQVQLADRWREFSKKGIGDTRYHGDVDWLECRSLNYLKSLVKGIRLVRDKASDAFETYELAKVDLVLGKIPEILHYEQVLPTDEKPIRDVMHRYFRAYFTTYTTNVQIEGPVCAFKADGGIISLKTAFEYKFATSHDEIATHVRGLFEDTSGYAQSKDWTRFYFVLYQTEAFISLDRLKSTLEKSSRKNWIPVLVGGPGARRPRKKRAGSPVTT